MQTILKYLFLVVTLIVTYNNSFASDEILEYAKTQPSFKGGTDSLVYFIYNNLNYPINDLLQRKEGTVYVKFYIDKEGKTNNPTVIKSNMSDDANNEALRIVNVMPNWNPGYNDNEVVSVYYTLPIKFKITQREENTLADFTINTQPEFPNGGAKAMLQFITDSLVYPKTEYKKKKEATIYVQFTINEDGSIADAEIIKNKDISGNFNNEALRLVNAMPNWIPATQNGIPVKMKYTLPIKFEILDEHEIMVKESWDNVSISPCNGITQEAEYKNGPSALKSYIENNIQYPKEASQQNMNGSVVVQFIVDEEGYVKYPKVVNGDYIKAYLNEALRVVNFMPRWNPKIVCGTAVKSIQQIPINFYIKY
ncbi:MAG: energy transducer TonB [Chitinophagales bacterium]|nr:energy transducer TonB [Chitinophagales bacterium]